MQIERIRLVCLFQIFLFFGMVYCSPDIEQGHDNCLTWNDDWSTLFLTCRVRNFNKPVTFKHKNSGNTVVCDIRGEQQCNPKEKRITINRFNHTITIVLEENKRNQNHDGEWMCIQGKSKQQTQVSILKGIITDTWVTLHGSKHTAENYTTITLECSSCREPQGLIAEFLENGKTIASVYQDSKGRCLFEQSECLPEKCSYLSTSNKFSVTLPFQQSKNYSCSMNFKDQHRNGTFSITASAKYTGKNFTVSENRTRIISNNSDVGFSFSPTTTTRSDFTNRGNGGIDLSQPTTKKSDLSSDGIAVKILVPTVVIVLILICLIIFYQWKKGVIFCHKDNASDFIEMKEYFKEQDLFQLNCKSCENTDKRTVTILCFACRQYYCDNCFSFHDNAPALKLHRYVKLELVPKTFDISMFTCHEHEHEGSEIDSFCNAHDFLCCEICRKTNHQICNVTSLTNFSTTETIKLLKNHLTKFSWCHKLLHSNKEFLKNGFEHFRMQLYIIKEQIELSTRSDNFTCDQIHRRFNRQHLKKKQLLFELDRMRSDFLKDKDRFVKTIRDVQNDIKHQREILLFLAQYSKSTYLIIAVKKFILRYSEIKKILDKDQMRYYVLDVQLEGGNTRVVITKNNLSSSLFTTMTRPFQTSCGWCVRRRTLASSEEENAARQLLVKDDDEIE